MSHNTARCHSSQNIIYDRIRCDTTQDSQQCYITSQTQATNHENYIQRTVQHNIITSNTTWHLTNTTIMKHNVTQGHKVEANILSQHNHENVTQATWQMKNLKKKNEKNSITPRCCKTTLRTFFLLLVLTCLKSLTPQWEVLQAPAWSWLAPCVGVCCKYSIYCTSC